MLRCESIRGAARFATDRRGPASCVGCAVSSPALQLTASTRIDAVISSKLNDFKSGWASSRFDVIVSIGKMRSAASLLSTSERDFAYTSTASINGGLPGSILCDMEMTHPPNCAICIISSSLNRNSYQRRVEGFVSLTLPCTTVAWVCAPLKHYRQGYGRLQLPYLESQSEPKRRSPLHFDSTGKIVAHLSLLLQIARRVLVAYFALVLKFGSMLTLT